MLRNILYFIPSVIFNTYFWIVTPSMILFVFAPLAIVSNEKIMRAAIYYYISVTLWLFEKFSGVKIVEKGMENLPVGKGYILCPRHMTNLEALIFYRRCPGLTAIGKVELFRVPALGRVLRKMKVIPVDRGAGKTKDHTNTIGQHITEKAVPLAIFPEGTRIKIGQRRNLRSGVYYVQETSTLPVICVSHNAAAHWLNGVPYNRPGVIEVTYHAPLPHGLDRKDFMNEVEKNVVTASEQLLINDNLLTENDFVLIEKHKKSRKALFKKNKV